MKSTVASPEITEGLTPAADIWPQMDPVSRLVMQILGFPFFTIWKLVHPHLAYQMCLAYLIFGLGWCNLCQIRFI